MEIYRRDYQRKNLQERIKIIVLVTALAIAITIFIKKTGLLRPAQKTEEQKQDQLISGPKVKLNRQMSLPELINVLRPAVFKIITLDERDKELGLGTGFFINDSGLAVSNAHIFKGSQKAKIEHNELQAVLRDFLAINEQKDLILFELPNAVPLLGGKRRKLNYLSLAEKKPEVGEKIFVIGNPLGLDLTVSDGIVSAIRKLEPFGQVIQITCPVSPGSSGSPVLNMNREVIGIASFQIVDGQNLNFTIPAKRIRELKPAKKTPLNGAFIVDVNLSPFEQGLQFYNNKQFNSALTFFQEACRLSPGDKEAFYYLGLTYFELRDRKAIDAFKTAIALDRFYVEAYCELARVYIGLNMKREALELMKQARQIIKDDYRILRYLGIAYCLNEEFSAGRILLEKSLSFFPDKESYLYLGLSLMGERKFNKAINILNIALDLDSNYLEAYLALGECLIEVKNWSYGIKKMNEAVLISPENPEVHFLLGLLYLGNDDLQSALQEKLILDKLDKKGEMLRILNQAISNYKFEKRIL